MGQVRGRVVEAGCIMRGGEGGMNRGGGGRRVGWNRVESYVRRRIVKAACFTWGGWSREEDCEGCMHHEGGRRSGGRGVGGMRARMRARREYLRPRRGRVRWESGGSQVGVRRADDCLSAHELYRPYTTLTTMCLPLSL